MCITGTVVHVMIRTGQNDVGVVPLVSCQTTAGYQCLGKLESSRRRRADVRKENQSTKDDERDTTQAPPQPRARNRRSV